MHKLLIITGPTGVGKTKFAVTVARKFNGELISADSRQVYKGMDIVTGKDTDEISKSGIRVWLCDLIDPDEPFSVSGIRPPFPLSQIYPAGVNYLS